VGTGAGVVLLGPVLGLTFGLLTNYIAKTETEAGEVARGLGKAALETFNYLVKFNDKYNVGAKVSDASSALYAKIKEADADGSVVPKLEEVSTRVGVASFRVGHIAGYLPLQGLEQDMSACARARGQG
jgi:hypothetical protein